MEWYSTGSSGLVLSVTEQRLVYKIDSSLYKTSVRLLESLYVGRLLIFLYCPQGSIYSLSELLYSKINEKKPGNGHKIYFVGKICYLIFPLILESP